MKNYLFAIVCFIFVFYGCTTAIDSISLSEKYMPLSIGNKWAYGNVSFGVLEKGKYSYLKEVVSIDSIQGKKYYRIKVTSLGKDSVRRYDYYQRISNDTLFSLYRDPENDAYSESIEGIFSLKKDDSVVIHSDDKGWFVRTMKVESKNKDKIEFLFNTSHTSDGQYWVVYEKGIGIIKSYSIWGGIKLLDYKIN